MNKLNMGTNETNVYLSLPIINNVPYDKFDIKQYDYDCWQNVTEFPVNDLGTFQVHLYVLVKWRLFSDEVPHR